MITMRLGTLLLRDAIITLTQLEQSLRAQVLGGGRLGTNLVELGFIDLNMLGRYLARSLDLPLAIADRFEKADPHYLELLGAEMADRHSAIPLGIEHDDPGAIGVVMCNPRDQASIAALEEHLKLRVQPYVAAELRLFYYLERYYSIRRRTRFTRSSKAGNTGQEARPARERRSTQPFHGLTAPSTVRIAPRAKRESSLPAAVPTVPTVLSLEEAMSHIDEAEQRGQIADAMLRYSIGRFACAALFMLRDRNAIGWLAQAAGLGAHSLERLSLPLGGSSVFQTAHDSAKPYRGAPVTAGHPELRALWDLFALDYEPNDIHVVPIVIRGRVVNLLYAHSVPGHKASEADANGLLSLTEHSADAYRRIISATHADKE